MRPDHGHCLLDDQNKKGSNPGYTAIGRLNGYMNQLGIDQRSLSGKEVNLTEAITANNAAKSRIMDVDFAKEQSNSVRLQILQQTATAALSQANMGPQAVLGFLGQ